MDCFQQTKIRRLKINLSGVEQALFNGVNDGIITKTQYRMFLGVLEKKYGRMLVRSDSGKPRLKGKYVRTNWTVLNPLAEEKILSCGINANQ